MGINNDGVAAGLGLPVLVWRKSQHSNPSGNCVELAELSDGGVAVRNSRYPNGPTLVYARDDMAAFIRGAKRGEFDDMLDQR